MLLRHVFRPEADTFVYFVFSPHLPARWLCPAGNGADLISYSGKSGNLA
jgi:hypothetical protein